MYLCLALDVCVSLCWENVRDLQSLVSDQMPGCKSRRRCRADWAKHMLLLVSAQCCPAVLCGGAAWRASAVGLSECSSARWQGQAEKVRRPWKDRERSKSCLRAETRQQDTPVNTTTQATSCRCAGHLTSPEPCRGRCGALRGPDVQFRASGNVLALRLPQVSHFIVIEAGKMAYERVWPVLNGASEHRSMVCSRVSLLFPHVAVQRRAQV